MVKLQLKGDSLVDEETLTHILVIRYYCLH